MTTIKALIYTIITMISGITIGLGTIYLCLHQPHVIGAIIVLICILYISKIVYISIVEKLREKKKHDDFVEHWQSLGSNK